MISRNRHMNLNYTEKCILVAEKDYISIEDKLNYVNERLKRIIKHEDEDGENYFAKNPYMKEEPIAQTTYYKRLGEMKKKGRGRGQLISKNYMFDLINEHDTLLEDRKELREFIEKAKDLDKIHTAVMAKREQIDLGRRIMSVKELIKTLMEKPDLEDEDQIERQIQLLTTSQ